MAPSSCVWLRNQTWNKSAGQEEAAHLLVMPGDQPRNYNYLPEDLDLLIRSAGELWDSTSGEDPHDVLSALQRETLDLAAAASRAELDRYPAEKLDLLIRSAGELWDSTSGASPHHCPRCGQVLPTPGRRALDRAAAVFQYELSREMGYEDDLEPDDNEQDGSGDVYGDIAVVDQAAQPARVGYTVSFEYTAEEAAGPLEAAMQAYGTLTDPQSMRPGATVTSPDGTREEIDLEAEEC